MLKVWFITGSSRGLWRSITEAALKKGDKVIATARNPQKLADLVQQYGDQIHPLALDVTNEHAVFEAVEQAHRIFGRLDVVVNNAGYGNIASIEDGSLDDFRAQMDTVFYGVVYVTKAVIPIMRKQQGGHIIQISSLGDRIGSVGLSAYQSAKWAVCGFSEVLSQEVSPFGIKVSIIEPGGMRTDWAGSSMTIFPVSEPYKQTVGAFVKAIHDHRGQQPGDPAKIAKVITDLTDMDEPPLRLLMGSDAVAYAEAASKALSDSDTKWKHLSESINFD